MKLRACSSSPGCAAGEPPWLAPIRAILRERLALFEENGCAEAAATCRRDLAIVEAEARRWWLEELTLAQAATELACSTDTIARRLKSGALTNARPGGRPRVPRAALWSHVGRQAADGGAVDAYLSSAPDRRMTPGAGGKILAPRNRDT